MKLIEALVVAQQEYGIYGDWKAIHTETGCFLGRGPYGMYLALDLDTRRPTPAVIGQSERLETVLAKFAEHYPHALHDDSWKVARWEG